MVAVFFALPKSVALDPPRGVIALDLLLTLGLVGGIRFLLRAVLERPFRGAPAAKGAREVLVVGAGNGGQLVVAELRRNPELGVPIGFVDDDPRKLGMRVAGLKVEGTTDQLPRVLGGAELMRQVREVRVEDVLGREPVRIEIARIGAYLSGEVVLVTGAGGSIGAELCRQISRVGPKGLVLVDNAETSLFEIRRELEHDRHFPRALAVLCDCKDAVRME